MRIVSPNFATFGPHHLGIRGADERLGELGHVRQRPDDEVIESAAPLFVPLAEEGRANTHVARAVAEIHLEPPIDAGIDTLVLGCTRGTIRASRIENWELGIVDAVVISLAPLEDSREMARAHGLPTVRVIGRAMPAGIASRLKDNPQLFIVDQGSVTRTCATVADCR